MKSPVLAADLVGKLDKGEDAVKIQACISDVWGGDKIVNITSVLNNSSGDPKTRNLWKETAKREQIR